MKDNNGMNSNQSSGNNGPKRRRGLTLSDELIRMRSEAIFGGKYRFLSRKSGSANMGFFECTEHRLPFEQHLSSHFAGRVPKNCPECYHRILSENSRAKEIARKRENHPHALSDDFVRNKINELYKGKLKFLKRDEEDYRYGIYECAHGKTLRNIVSYALKNNFPLGCTTCTREKRNYQIKLTPEIVRDKSFDIFDGKVYYLERCDKDKERGIFVCREHGIRFTQKLYHHFRGQNSCELCKKDPSHLSSLTYKELLKYYDESSIVREKKFDDCKNLYHLRFDFYIEKANLLVECDGEGHFFNIPIWGGEEGFRTRVSNDQIKDHFTKKNSINFIRIGFYEMNKIKEIISESIEKINKGEIVYRIHQNRLPNK